jgi:hypothetical protein
MLTDCSLVVSKSECCLTVRHASGWVVAEADLAPRSTWPSAPVSFGVLGPMRSGLEAPTGVTELAFTLAGPCLHDRFLSVSVGRH